MKSTMTLDCIVWPGYSLNEKNCFIGDYSPLKDPTLFNTEEIAKTSTWVQRTRLFI